MNYTTTQTTVKPTIQELEKAISDYYGPEMWQAVLAGLGVITSLALKGRSHPLSLIYEGPSGRGKSTCINLFEPDREATKARLYRLDNFTAKAFVTQAANVPSGDLDKVDLLPKLKDKILLVKELAPQFRGTDADLRERFATFTAVLDGRGYQTAAGVHGTRGYTEEHIFNWLGATTPIPAKTDSIMAQLGNRLLRYEFEGQEQTEEELLDFMENNSHSRQEALLRKQTNDFLEEFFRQNPVSSIDPDEIEFDRNLMLEVVRFATLIAHGRVEVINTAPADNEPEFQAGAPEGPHRLILLLKQLALGLAVASGQKKVTAGDMEILRHVALSSIPANRRRVLRVLLWHSNTVTSKLVETELDVSRPTARRYMKELEVVGIVDFQEGAGPEGDKISLRSTWNWLKMPLAEKAPEEPEKVGV